MSDDGYCEVDFEDVSGDADPVEFWDRREVVARKAHHCTQCSEEIAVGDRHLVVAYKFEGMFSADRICLLCQEAASEFNYYLLGGDLWAMFSEEWEQGAHVQACINRLSTPRGKEHMRQQWLKWQERHEIREADRRRRLAELRKSVDAVREEPR